VLYERAVNQISKEKAKEIWNMYIKFEQDYGNQETVLKVQKRKAALYPESGDTFDTYIIDTFDILTF
jgi:vacuolar-type H+-ATPase subunit C/Vma6